MPVKFQSSADLLDKGLQHVTRFLDVFIAIGTFNARFVVMHAPVLAFQQCGALIGRNILTLRRSLGSGTR